MASISVVLSRPRNGIPEPAFRGMAEKIAAAVGAEIPFAVVSHLYDAEPQGPVFQFLRELPGDLLVLAPLYPRAAHLVLRANGVDVAWGNPDRRAAPNPAGRASGPRTAWYLDYRDYLMAEELAEKVRDFLREHRPATVHAAPSGFPSGPGWRFVEEETRPRWYPVIDAERCTDCFECVNFCLFGVFDLDTASRIFVAQPDACRPGCPACARVCPSGAIVFPLYADAIIAGAEGNGNGGIPPGLIAISPTSLRRTPAETNSRKEQAEAERRRYLAEAGSEDAKREDGPSADVSEADRSSRRADGPDLDRWMDELEGWDP